MKSGEDLVCRDGQPFREHDRLLAVRCEGELIGGLAIGYFGRWSSTGIPQSFYNSEDGFEV
jgi:hypothetical protein